MADFTLHRSIWRITAQTPVPVVLLEFGDLLEGVVRLTPEPEVDVAAMLGGSGRTYARPNTFHTLTFRHWKVHNNVPLAAGYQVSQTIAVKAMRGVDFTMELLHHSGSNVLHKGTVTSYPSDHHQFCTRFDYTIYGGDLVSTLAPIGVLTLPDGSAIGLPDGSLVGGA